MSPITSPMRVAAVASCDIVSTVRCASVTARLATSVEVAACPAISLMEVASSSAELAAEATFIDAAPTRSSAELASFGAKLHPRTLERVPAGARFHFRIVMDVLCPEDRELLPRLAEGLRLLEDESLGGGGSRGRGRVALSNLKAVWRGRSFYASGAAEQELLAGSDLEGLQTLVTSADFAEKLAE